MKITNETIDGTAVVQIEGDIDGTTAPAAQTEILPLIEAGCRIVLGMSAVNYMSSAGLRMLLLMFRKVAAAGGQLVLTGLSEDIKDTMALTGFLDFFATADTVDAGLELLKQ